MSDREAIRRRPGMYVGGCDGDGVLHLVMEVVSNAFDQVLVGRCTAIHVAVGEDDTVVIEDDGPGIPVTGPDGAPFLERALTRRHDTATADGHAPHVHIACGIGLAAVNALCEELRVRVVRDGLEHRVVYRAGVPVETLASVPSSAPTGTRIELRADRTIFSTQRVPRVRLAAQLEELSFLAPQVRLTWVFGADRHARRGLSGLVEQQVRGALGPTARGADRIDEIDVDVALAWSKVDPRWPVEPVLHSFVNLMRTRGHGTHVQGLLAGLRGLSPRDLAPRHLRVGLVAAVSIVLPDVRYGRPTKDQLVSPAARRAVSTVADRTLRDWAVRNPDAAAAVVEQARRCRRRYGRCAIPSPGT